MEGRKIQNGLIIFLRFLLLVHTLHINKTDASLSHCLAASLPHSMSNIFAYLEAIELQ